MSRLDKRIERLTKAHGQLVARRAGIDADRCQVSDDAVRLREGMGPAILDGADVVAIVDDIARLERRHDVLEAAVAAIDERIAAARHELDAARRQRNINEIQRDMGALIDMNSAAFEAYDNLLRHVTTARDYALAVEQRIMKVTPPPNGELSHSEIHRATGLLSELQSNEYRVIRLREMT